MCLFFIEVIIYIGKYSGQAKKRGNLTRKASFAKPQDNNLLTQQQVRRCESYGSYRRILRPFTSEIRKKLLPEPNLS